MDFVGTKKRTKIGYVVVCLVLAACGARPEVTPQITAVLAATVPTGVIETQTPSIVQEREPVTLDSVKNVPEPLKLEEDAAGELTGLPEGITGDEKDAIQGFYDAVRKTFPASDIYYSLDPQESRWVIFPMQEGKLIYEVVSSGSGSLKQYPDYPISYRDAGGFWEVIGDYQELEIPGGTVGIVWLGDGPYRFPQFLADEVTFPNGDRYFRYYMEYQADAESQNPWGEVPGMAELVTHLLNPAEMQTEKGTRGVLLEASGTYQGITVHTQVGVTPDINEAIGGGGLEFNDAASPVPVGDRLAEATVRAWYAAYLQRNSLDESQYSLQQFVDDYKKDPDKMKVDEYVYDPATQTNSVMKVGLDTPLTLVVTSEWEWYNGPNAIRNHQSIQRYGNGLLVVEIDTRIDSSLTRIQMSSSLCDIADDLDWLSQQLSAQETDVTFNIRPGVQYDEILQLVWPGIGFSTTTDENALFDYSYGGE